MDEQNVQQQSTETNNAPAAPEGNAQPIESAPATNEGAKAPEAQPAKEQPAAKEGSSQQYDTLLGNKPAESNQSNTDKADGEGKDQAVIYDLKASIPEGFEYSQEESNKFIDVIKGMNLSNEQANAIAKYGFEWAGNLRNQFQAEIDNMVKDWGETAKTELGADCDKVLAKAGGTISLLEKEIPNLRNCLAETGAGNRVEIIRAFALLNDRLSGDPGMATGAGPLSNNKVISARYPNTDFSRYK